METTFLSSPSGAAAAGSETTTSSTTSDASRSFEWLNTKFPSFPNLCNAALESESSTLVVGGMYNSPGFGAPSVGFVPEEDESISPHEERKKTPIRNTETESILLILDIGLPPYHS